MTRREAASVRFGSIACTGLPAAGRGVAGGLAASVVMGQLRIAADVLVMRGRPMPGSLLGLLIVGTFGLPLLASAAQTMFVDTSTSLDAEDVPTLTGLVSPGIGGVGGFFCDNSFSTPP